MREAECVVLIGMPGVGKSTAGVVLAKILNLDFIDTDLLIQRSYVQNLQELMTVRSEVSQLVRPLCERGGRTRCLGDRMLGGLGWMPWSIWPRSFPSSTSASPAELALSRAPDARGFVRGRCGTDDCIDAIIAERAPLYDVSQLTRVRRPFMRMSPIGWRLSSPLGERSGQGPASYPRPPFSGGAASRTRRHPSQAGVTVGSRVDSAASSRESISLRALGSFARGDDEPSPYAMKAQVSMATSPTMPARPGTNSWWISSLEAYNAQIATEHSAMRDGRRERSPPCPRRERLLSRAISTRMPSSVYSVAWAHLRTMWS